MGAVPDFSCERGSKSDGCLTVIDAGVAEGVNRIAQSGFSCYTVGKKILF